MSEAARSIRLLCSGDVVARPRKDALPMLSMFSRIASVMRSVALGMGAGRHSDSGGGHCAPSRCRSNRTSDMSTPDAPSIMAWWPRLNRIV